MSDPRSSYCADCGSYQCVSSVDCKERQRTMAKQTKTVERKGYLYMEYGYTADFLRQEWAPVWKQWKLENNSERIYLSEHTMVCEVPIDFDPRPAQIKALEAQKREITAKFQAAVTEINARISKLQAITFDEVQ